MRENLKNSSCVLVASAITSSASLPGMVEYPLPKVFRPTSVLHSIVFSVLNTCTYKIRYSEWDPNLHPHFTSGDIFILCNTFSEPTFWLSLPHKANRGIPRLGHVTARRLGNFRGIFLFQICRLGMPSLSQPWGVICISSYLCKPGPPSSLKLRI